MKKKLKSGIEVDAGQYYTLLEWKDNNITEFMSWCDYNFISYSINEMNEENYKQLLHYTAL